MIDFHGWDMPVQYASLLEEHHAVRQRVGVFDVSHMGEIEVRGREALRLVNYVATNDAARLKPGQAQYSGLLYEHGGFVDDILVHKVADDDYFLCVNASNQDKDYEHIVAYNQFDATIENAGSRYAQLAGAGSARSRHSAETDAGSPSARSATITLWMALSARRVGADRADRLHRRGRFLRFIFRPAMLRMSGMRSWRRVPTSGSSPCGLGARNTLRLEAAMALYDHEIHASITPWEAGLGWIVKMDKGDFVGRQALALQNDRGDTRKLLGFEMTGRGIGRDGYEVCIDNVGAGWVNSGGPSPTLNRNIGLCYLPRTNAEASGPIQIETGRPIQVMVRGQSVAAVTVPTPFYKRINK